MTTPPEGRVSVYATDDPVAASHLMAMLADLGIDAVQLTRPEIYPGLWPQYAGAYQILVRESEAESRRADIEAAVAELDQPPPSPSESKV
jgi:hypothetical protein